MTENINIPGKDGFYIYILRCNDDTLYTGWTVNLVRREKMHNSGKGAKYTRNRIPVKIVYFEELSSKAEAAKREYEIKHSYSKLEKEEMISSFLLNKG